VITNGLDERLRNKGSHDGVELTSLGNVAEDGRAERRAVQCAILHNPREGPVERPRAPRARLLQVVHERVAVDDLNILGAEPGGDRGLARGDASC